ncbi:MAG: S46 family peptidase [Pyrinomonadaceae bacterium]
MKPVRLMSAALAVLLMLTTFSPAARADEGMWTFNNLPRTEIKRRYGFEVTDEWVRKARMATVRFPNGTGSFVSSEGLVLTNYHIVEDAVGELSTAQKDYAKEGFVAHSRGDELKLPNVELNLLMSIEDVTASVNGAVKPGMSDVAAAEARGAEISRIEAASTAATSLRSDVVTLYQGGQYNLYRYKKYGDVRLVFVPEFQTAFFGGDPDNFNFPRYNLDMALVRVYEGDKPVRPESFFRWSKTGVRENDLVFVTGSPGTTQRLNTVAHLKFLRDTGIPLLLAMLESRRDALQPYMAQGDEQTRRGQNELNYAENFIKVYKGQLEGLRTRSLIARKSRDEAALRRFVSADARRRKEYGDAWDSIARARASLASYERDRRFLGGLSLTDNGAAFNSPLFNYARTLVRLADEGSKPDAERLPEYANARRASLELALFSPAPVYDDFETMKLAASLTLMRDTYGATNPLVRKVLNGKSPEARAAELIAGTKLKDVEFRKSLAANGASAVAASNDPLIALARSIDAEARTVRKRYETEVIGVERTAYGKIARALFEKEGTGLYPDATFTPRLSYGAVKGYMEHGKRVAPFTNFAGLYARAESHKYIFPYHLARLWTDKKGALDLRTPFNFVATNDITGGNSGSPSFNKKLELVGLIFDGNIESLVGNFYYDETVNRSISVDSRGMLEVLRKLYGANEVASELTR